MTDRPDDIGHDKAPDWTTPEPKTIELTPDDTADPKRRAAWAGRSRAWLLGMVALLVLFGASPYWAPPLAGLLPWSKRAGEDAPAAGVERIDQRLAALEQHQAALEQQLARLEQQLGGAASSGAQQEQAAALRQLTDRIAVLEQRPSPPQGADPAQLAALQGELRQLGERVGKLEARAAAPAPQAGARTDQALLLALGQLRGALDAGRPFAAELGTVETLGRARPEVTAALQPLDSAARKGVPATATLARRFEQEVAPAVMREAAVPESESWSERILGRLRSLVVIRRVGDGGVSASDPVEAAVAHAEAALAANDLAGAVAAVENLPERVAAPARGWLADARARLAAEQAVAALGAQLAARLAADAERTPERPPER